MMSCTELQSYNVLRLCACQSDFYMADVSISIMSFCLTMQLNKSTRWATQSEQGGNSECAHLLRASEMLQ